jgi:anthranilate phosphoribosyltransferase
MTQTLHPLPPRPERTAMNEMIEAVATRRDLTQAEIGDAIAHMVDDGAPHPQIAGLLIGLRVKGETADELVGAAAAFRDRAVPVPIAARPDLDTAGTGGDGMGTINLSTSAALVAAAAGLTVAKHGNRSVSSRCGSADLLEAMGVPIECGPETAGAALAADGFAFLFARSYHPAMAAIAPVRQALGVRTLFNLLGPLTNPARARTQLVGVADRSKARLMAEALMLAGVERALVVSAECGIDEVSPLGETHVIDAGNHGLLEYSLSPADFGLAPTGLDAIAGGGPEENAAIVRRVLSGEALPARTAILMNAAASLVVAGAANDYREGAILAAETIDSGKAGALIERLAQPERSAA